MNNNWVGFMVSVEMKQNQGTYQGQINEVTELTMTLTKAFHNGVPYHESVVVLNATDIEELKMIESQPKATNGRSTVTVAKPVAKRTGRSVSMSECTPSNNKNCVLQNNMHLNHTKSKPNDNTEEKWNTSGNQECGLQSLKAATPNKKDKSGNQKWNAKWRDEACFGDSMDPSMKQDFDFEKNLALFNKKAVWQEINASHKPDVVHSTDQCGRRPPPPSQKYRHDENVIATLPPAYRRIAVPAPDVREYVTDDGLVIPSVTQELRRQLMLAADRRGLTCDRRTELLGRAAAEMALQLLGGGHRLSPHNTHQWPTVVCLCGPHAPGAAAVNCARHLASHGVDTLVVCPETRCAVLEPELALYRLTGNRVVACGASGGGCRLPPGADLIVVALCDDATADERLPGGPAHAQLAQWTNQNRAPVLALDPPAQGTAAIPTKFSLLPVLPLSHSPDNGKLYLCNLGFPSKIFKDVGIKYSSPFGPKFVIPLHPNDT